MRISTFTATALVAIAATGIAAGTAAADPTVPAPDQVQTQTVTPAVHGEDHGVNYTTTLADAGKSIVTAVTGGRFALDTVGKNVTLTNDAGQVVMQYPLVVESKDSKGEVAADISADGSQLTLTPQAAHVATAKDISAQDWFFAELQHASLGAAVGALLGALIGIWFFGVGLIPAALLGGVIGLLVAGGPSLLDAGAAYFGGQP
ncbi:hypothetical protein [Nocardia aurantia]|uniref:DUF8020 domain-containing protein n=1 Tax=Nocardia aurantia TaxID=2585199 RepID=A0A7K0DQB7_9NOCA|nr:hypothetical protein [Nocardia aurantia]MQY27965.1 hypothetical protein [Nocardia aurantia]